MTHAGPEDAPVSVWAEVSNWCLAGRPDLAEAALLAASRADDSARVRLTLGSLAAERHEWFTAITHWTRSIELASQTGDRRTLAAVMFNLSAAYREWGDDSLARRFLQHGLAQQDDFGPEELLELLNDAIRQRRCELADTLLDAAAELIEDDSPLTPHLAATRGLLLGLQGDAREGIRWLWSAYCGHVQQQDWKGAGQDLVNLCEFCQQVGRLRVALRCATFAVEHLTAVKATDLAQQARQAARRIRQLLALRRQRPGLN